MKEFMDLFGRMVVALEGINRSLGNANGSLGDGSGAASADAPPSPGGGVRGPEVRGPDRSDRLKGVPSIARRPSDVRDVSMVSAEILERSRAASVTFAIDNMLVPWSEAHMRELIAYERKVDAEFGEGSSEKLPWRNLIPRGEDVGR